MTGVEVVDGSGVILAVAVLVGVEVGEGETLEVGKEVLLGLGVSDGGREGGAMSEATTLVGEPLATSGMSGSGVHVAELSAVFVSVIVLSAVRVCDSLKTRVANTS